MIDKAHYETKNVDYVNQIIKWQMLNVVLPMLLSKYVVLFAPHLEVPLPNYQYN